jgi:2'-5' RNA ligase
MNQKGVKLLRAFIAIELPASLQQAIQMETASLHKALGSSLVRWVPPQNVHLTLKFLGDISPANIELLMQMLTREADQCSTFDIQIVGIGSFPTQRRPRVIWVGLNAPSSLETLQRGIESAAARLGYSQEERPFSPHLTIGRVHQNLSTMDLQMVRAALEAAQVDDMGTTTVKSIDLFKSDLQSTGSIYTKLFAAPLKTHQQPAIP